MTNLIIQKMEQGIIPWRKPYSDYGLPKNYVSGKPYRGINAFLLNLLPNEHPLYLTFKQASELGGKVIKGSKASRLLDLAVL